MITLMDSIVKMTVTTTMTIIIVTLAVTMTVSEMKKTDLNQIV